MAKQIETPAEINACVLSTVTVQAHVISNMKAAFTKPWPKLAGRMPTDVELMAAAAFSKSTAGHEATFMALQLRDEGCSVLQLGQACGAGPAHNHSRDHSGKVWHHFNRGKLGTGTYTLTFTPKGEKWLADYLSKLAAGQAAGQATSPAKAVAKAKGKAKAKRGGKVAPAQTPISEAAEGVMSVSPVGNTTEGPVEVGTTITYSHVDAGVEAEFDAVSPADLSALAAHFNTQS
jgi:hypothetical protein